ncbi:cytochrome c oxidase assembly protein [Tsuneonella amylolytica]|uniref:cytochrome c oxidase assembly protein n=1 Tax=Tsuneonella amylolytica TaxID=2338327 RepID=UPI000EA89F43|nr:cytochrome c oxidase assembly protein [Tsuneonella amylolytica]
METTPTAHATSWSPYCGEAPSPAHWLMHWNWDPVLLAMLAALIVAGARYSPRTMRSQVGFVGAMVILFVTPLCALGSALFVARSVHHLALAFVLAPLLVAAVGKKVYPPLPLGAATLVQAAVFWAWHLPTLYELAMSNDAVFWTMQVTITASAAAWWAAVRRSGALKAGASLLAQMVQMGVLGALLVFAGRALYAPHFGTIAAWGLTPLEDQQIAGLVMWVVGGGFYLLFASARLWRALGPDPQPRAA